MEIDKGAEKKLKRGLQDISPLFQSLPPAALEPSPSRPSTVPFNVQFLSVCVPDREGDAFLANTYIASQIAKQSNLSASLISIAPGMNAVPPSAPDPFPALELLDSRISRLRLSHQELWTFTQNGSSKEKPTNLQPPGEEKKGRFIFLDFEPSQFRSLARISLLLDRVLFFIEPEAASLQEAYRSMKIFWRLNREIEFFLLFREEESVAPREEYLFERFSLITSRFLGFSPRWLGHLAFSENDKLKRDVEGWGFHAESLLSPEGLRRPLAPEKNRFWQSLKGILNGRA